MSERRNAPPPTGLKPPTANRTPGGEALDLVRLAGAVCDRYYVEFTDEHARYGEVGRQWCVHDNQHLLNWAVDSVHGLVDLDHEVAWLTKLLEVRGFPVERMARNLEIDAVVVREQVADGGAIADALNATAAMVRERGSFL